MSGLLDATASTVKATTTVTRVLRVVGWAVVAQIIIMLVAFPLFIMISLVIGSTLWSWTSSGYERMAGELLFTAGFDCTMPLILLLVTGRARSLNRSMIWVLAGWAVWHLFNAPLPMLGIKPIGCESFFLYNDRMIVSDWFLTVALMFKAVSSITGIALYLFWEGRRNHGKPDRISDEAPKEVTRKFCENELQPPVKWV